MCVALEPGVVALKTLRRNTTLIAGFCLAAIATHLLLRFGLKAGATAANAPLLAAIALGGTPLLYDLLRKALRRDFGSDLLGGLAVLTSVWLGEYLAGAIVVLMLSGGDALESYAVRSASSVLAALARRMPAVAHRRSAGGIEDIALDEVAVGDTLVVFPHEICPVDGTVVEGHGVMDESYLTGEPFEMSKTPGSAVLSGRGQRRRGADDPDDAARRRFALREDHAGDARVGAEPAAPAPPRRSTRRDLHAGGAGRRPGRVGRQRRATRFLAVLVVATPCPLLIAIPVAIIGSISLCARRAIIVKSPAVLEQIATCRTAIFDKTGTLTYGEPTLTDVMLAPGRSRREVLALAASLERYSKHPLAVALLDAATAEARAARRSVGGHRAAGRGPAGHRRRPPRPHHQPAEGDRRRPVGGAAHPADRRRPRVRRRDRRPLRGDAPVPRRAAAREPLVRAHLGPKHQFHRMMLVSGDRESEVRYLAEQVGISEVHAQQSPEQKLALVRRETAAANTLYLGDGINDAPAMMAATVGIAFGEHSDVTAEAAGVVMMDNSLKKVDEFLHISRRMRAIALQSAVGGMALSVVGMALAAAGYLPPVAGAIAQEVIDVVAVLNALRAAFPPAVIHDF